VNPGGLSLLSLSGGLILWAAFLELALIARKFEVVFGKHTRWGWMAAAPTGLVIYSLLGVSGLGGLEPATAREASYWILGVSGLACGWSARRFWLLLRSLEARDL